MALRLKYAAVVAVAGISLATPPAAGMRSPLNAETPADALARNIRTLSANPNNFRALIAAGKAALGVGDVQAAAGFFGRARELNPHSPLALAGIGAAVAAAGDPKTALIYFARAERLGATRAAISAERGLAYDLLGDHAAAQDDYRAAIAGENAEEARRRLALSLALSGDTTSALDTLQPLLDRFDPAAERVRVLILALGGNLAEAKTVAGSKVAGAWHHLQPFLRRLPTLTASEKAAAVHLGIFPGESPLAEHAAAEGLGGSLNDLFDGDAPTGPLRAVPGRMQYGSSPASSIQAEATMPRSRHVPGPMKYGAATAPEAQGPQPAPLEAQVSTARDRE